MHKSKIGLLPLYVALYDQFWPEMRVGIDAFHKTIIKELLERNLEVVSVPVCRLRSEFIGAVKLFEKENVDAIVSLHLAYSPSLESAEVLTSTKLPLIILDTTPAYEFSPKQQAEALLYNHGIHGVQDMCNVLRRSGKGYFIEAGHWEKSDVLERVVSDVNAVKIAAYMKSARVGRIGEPFNGMGDFDVPPDVLRSTIGVNTIVFDFNTSKDLFLQLDPTEIDAEVTYNLNHFLADGVDADIHRQAAATCLAVRKWLEKEKLTAFTVNFMAIDSTSGLNCMPFLEASKAMARGIGYAGEGDVLTAALVGALLSVYSETSFTEMFCPDWKNNSIYVSHMGEMNIALSADRPVLTVKDFPFTDANDTVVAYGRFKPGQATFVNLAPLAENKYELIVSAVEMLDVVGENNMQNTIHGWFKPAVNLSDFLESYSKAGGTHHAVLVYGDKVNEIAKFGKIMGWDIVRI